eukprot:PhF_6_TR19064/c0_g1_i1/m.28026
MSYPTTPPFSQLGFRAQNAMRVAFSVLHIEAWGSGNQQQFVPFDLLEDCMDYLPVRMVVRTAEDVVHCADGGIEEIYCDGHHGTETMIQMRGWYRWHDFADHLARSPRLFAESSSSPTTTNDEILIFLVKAAWHNWCGRNEESLEYIRHAESMADTSKCHPASVEVLQTAFIRYDVTRDFKVLKTALDQAIARLDEVPAEKYKETVVLINSYLEY